MAQAERSSEWVDKEILRYPTGLHAIASVALDAMDFGNDFTDYTGVRNVIPAGTILKVSATNADKHVRYNGSGTIAGILGRPIDLLAKATTASQAAPMFFAGAVFATEAIVGFTQYASALMNDLKTCLFK